jgi:hypothetical protein
VNAHAGLPRALIHLVRDLAAHGSLLASAAPCEVARLIGGTVRGSTGPLSRPLDGVPIG